MGAETRFLTFENCATTTELHRLWRIAQDEDAHQRGHDIYQGSIKQADIEKVTPRYPTRDAAYKAGQAANPDKRTAWAFPYGDATKAFPQTAADKALVASHEKVVASVANFEMDVLKRFLASKSASKKCIHCDSVISKKSRVRLGTPANQTEIVRLRNATGQIEQRWQFQDAIRDLTACPACSHELLMTATDLSRKAALEKKARELFSRRQTALQKYAATAKPYGYYVVACVPT